VCDLMADAPSVALGSSVPGFRFNKDALPHILRDYPEIEVASLGPGSVSFIMDARLDHQIVWVSGSLLRLSQYTADEVLAQKCFFWRGRYSSNYRQLCIQEALKKRERLSIELLNYRADGCAFISAQDFRPLGDHYFLVIQTRMLLLERPLDNPVGDWHPLQVEIWLRKRQFPEHVHEAFAKAEMLGRQLAAMTLEKLKEFGMQDIEGSILLNFLEIEIAFRNQVGQTKTRNDKTKE
jgi:hypothetical protein